MQIQHLLNELKLLKRASKNNDIVLLGGYEMPDVPRQIPETIIGGPTKADMPNAGLRTVGETEYPYQAFCYYVYPLLFVAGGKIPDNLRITTDDLNEYRILALRGLAWKWSEHCQTDDENEQNLVQAFEQYLKQINFWGAEYIMILSETHFSIPEDILKAMMEQAVKQQESGDSTADVKELKLDDDFIETLENNPAHFLLFGKEYDLSALDENAGLESMKSDWDHFYLDSVLHPEETMAYMIYPLYFASNGQIPEAVKNRENMPLTEKDLYYYRIEAINALYDIWHQQTDKSHKEMKEFEQYLNDLHFWTSEYLVISYGYSLNYTLSKEDQQKIRRHMSLSEHVQDIADKYLK